MERTNQVAGRWSALTVLALLVVTSSVWIKATATSDDNGPITPALFVFGDSISDVGNNNFLETAAKADFKPYGVDFGDGPTGRFSNGKLVIDFLAEKLRLPSPPPYMKLLKEEKLANTTTGVNYASSGCGILEQTGSNLGECLSLRKQIQLFNNTKFEISSAFKSNEELKHHLAKSVFIVNIGSNDFINNYLQESFNTSALYTPDQFAYILHQKLYAGIRRLYMAGARKFVVYNVGLIGCTPAMRATRGGRCVKSANKIVLPLNQRFPLTVKKLNSHLEGITVVHQRHNPLNSRTAGKYGFKDVSRPCCPCCIASGKDAKCNTEHCSNRDDYAYWDIFHTTDKINSIMANLCFDKVKNDCDSYSVKQYSIKELAAL